MENWSLYTLTGIGIAPEIMIFAMSYLSNRIVSFIYMTFLKAVFSHSNAILNLSLHLKFNSRKPERYIHSRLLHHQTSLKKFSTNEGMDSSESMLGNVNSEGGAPAI